MSAYGTDALLTVLLTVALLPLAMLPILGTVVRRYGRLRGWPMLAAAGLLGSAAALAAFTVFPLPEPGTLDCAQRSLFSYWQREPFASIAPIADAFRAQGLGAVTSGVFLQVFFNILLFVPYGFFLHQVTRWRGLAVVMAGAATSLAIEVTQGTSFFGAYPCPYRLFDVDDLLVNTAGAAIGLGLSYLLTRAWPGSNPAPMRDDAPPGLPRRVLAAATDFALVWTAAAAARGLIAWAAYRADDLEHALEVLTRPGVTRLIDLVVSVVVLLLVPLARHDQATLGMRLLDLVPARASRPDRVAADWQALIRYAVRWLPLALFAPAAYAIWAADLIVARMRKDRRSLTDLAAGSVTRTRTAVMADGSVLTVPQDATEPEDQD